METTDAATTATTATTAKRQHLRIACPAPRPLTEADQQIIGDRFGGCFGVATRIFARALGPGIFTICSTCGGSTNDALKGCDSCMGVGYQWAMRTDALTEILPHGEWETVDWSSGPVGNGLE